MTTETEFIKLERLKLPAACNSPEGAQNIFKEISDKTGADVCWELGKGLPVKKDPCVKLTGSIAAVKSAREMLLQRLETHCNRVVLKIDVPHFEHPCLIGKGGKLIKQVMEATGCHIHFPDKNRYSVNDKSNQVSITGEAINVERARVMLRALIPVQIHFEVVFNNYCDELLKSMSPEKEFVDNLLGFQISAIPEKDKVYTIVLRCYQNEFSNQRQKLLQLMDILCPKRGGDQPVVQVVIDMEPHHQKFVKGQKGKYIEEITKKTGVTTITFPNEATPSFEKRLVKISGSVDCVYMGWQELMSYLPVCLTFDVNETRELRESVDFMEDYDIKVCSRPKPNYHVKTVSVKGPEKFARQILQYRQHVLRLPNLNFSSEANEANAAFKFLKVHQESTRLLNDIILISPPSSLEDCINAFNSHNAEYFINHSKLLRWSVFEGRALCDNHDILNTAVTHVPCATDQRLYSYNLPEVSYSHFGISPSNTNVQCDNSTQIENLILDNNWGPSGSKLEGGFLYPENNNHVSLYSSEHLEQNNGYISNSEMNKSIEGSQILEYLASYSENDYYRKKLMAAKAMRRPIESEEATQVPSNQWAGYGFSQSMPASVIKKSFEKSNQSKFSSLDSNASSSSSDDLNASENIFFHDFPEDYIWCNSKKEFAFSHSNCFDFLRDTPGSYNYPVKDKLADLLWRNGLHNCIDIFNKQEIDFHAFLLLNDQDLLKLGIGFQSRMKLICIIRELQDNGALKLRKKFDAAPGAERKSEHFSYFSDSSKQHESLV